MKKYLALLSVSFIVMVAFAFLGRGGSYYLIGLVYASFVFLTQRTVIEKLVRENMTKFGEDPKHLRSNYLVVALLLFLFDALLWPSSIANFTLDWALYRNTPNND